MNFLYTILTFVVTTLIFFCIRQFSGITGDGSIAFLVFTIIGSVATFISMLCAIFANMNYRQRLKEQFNEIRMYNKKIVIKEEELVQYKKEMENNLTKIYPDYEKELFKGMTPGDVEHLNAVLVKYPELKFNGVLKQYTDRITQLLNDKSAYNRDIQEGIRSIRNIYDNDWFFMSVAKPEFIEKLLVD